MPVDGIASTGQDNRIFLGAPLELLLIIANIGTAVVIFPVVGRRTLACTSVSLMTPDPEVASAVASAGYKL